MTAIRFNDGLATTVHQGHINVPQTFNMRCVIPFHPSIGNCCTCKSSYIGKSPSPNHPTDDFPITLNYTPGIYAEGMPGVYSFRLSVRMFYCCSFVRTSFRHVEFASKFCVKVSQVVYISATSHQKAFIFGP